MADAILRGASERLEKEYGAVIATFGFYYLMKYGKEHLGKEFSYVGENFWAQYLEMDVGFMAAAFICTMRKMTASNAKGICKYLSRSIHVAEIDLFPEESGNFTLRLKTCHAKELFEEFSQFQGTGKLFDLLDAIPGLSLSDKAFKATYLLRICRLKFESGAISLTGIPPVEQFYARFMRDVHGVR